MKTKKENSPNYLIDEINLVRDDLKNNKDLSDLEITQELQKVNQILDELVQYKTRLRRKEISKSRFSLNFNFNTPNFDRLLKESKLENEKR